MEDFRSKHVSRHFIEGVVRASTQETESLLWHCGMGDVSNQGESPRF